MGLTKGYKKDIRKTKEVGKDLQYALIDDFEKVVKDNTIYKNQKSHK